MVILLGVYYCLTNAEGKLFGFAIKNISKKKTIYIDYKGHSLTMLLFVMNSYPAADVTFCTN